MKTLFMMFISNLFRRVALAVLLAGSCQAVFPIVASAQQSQSDKRWTLQQCIDYALQNNLQLRQSIANTELSRLNLNQSKGSMLPTINGNASHSYNYGRSIDPVTNTFVNERIRSNNFSLNGNMVLFDGLQRQNSVKQNTLELEASKLDVETNRNNIIIQVVTAYMQVLFSDDLVQTSTLQMQNSQQQLDRVQKLFKAGSVAEGNVLELNAQVASDELNILNAQNQKDLAELSLAQLLNIPNNQGFEVERPAVLDPGLMPLVGTPASIYATAEQTQPQLKSAAYRVKSTLKGVAVAKGNYSPSLSLSGNIYTLYSTGNNFRPVFSGQTQTVPVGFIPGPTPTDPPQLVYAQQPLVSYAPYAFTDQVYDNISKSIGLNLSIPILNGFQARNSIGRAIINHRNAELNADIQKQQLYQSIEKAFTDARAAEKKWVTSTKQLNSFEKAFNYAQLRFNNGALNSTDYNVAKMNFVTAQSNLLQAKYDYIFKLKVLDFYQGKPLAF
jgi:outer membrane protein